ncbi:hypothetical protein OVA24_18795 [Luteolibacter sp. SL250]|uniref:hypothetical protein n=1 Tax=Luteolibacter sp. SL250 TaxID=2995170 RepID=UPI002271B8AD|nr:hypothetical protein [Luteolibacter sp. SL250]WAC19278.1 hypothetical protein OVA24_18795 [Luteolibacter sp. SL250]
MAIVLAGCAFSYLAGWGTHSLMVDESNAPNSIANAGSPSRDRRREDIDETEKLVARWMDRLDGAGPTQVAGEIPPGELRVVINGVMTGVWGDLSAADRAKLEALIGEWALDDPEAALSWARGLRHPQQREVGLTYIAAALADGDPHRAFGIYAEQEKVTHTLAEGKILALITKLCGEAVANGPQALLDLQRRIPRNETNGITGVNVVYPDGFDYAAMLDGLAESAKNGQGEWPYELSSPLSQWAVKDPDAAFSYISSMVGDGRRFQFHDLTERLVDRWGATATNEWVGRKISSLAPAGRRAFLEMSGIINSPGSLVSVINGVTDTATANELRYEAIQATASTTPRNFEVLADLPTEEKIAIISRLRGLKQTDYLKSMMTKWEIPPEKIDLLLDAVRMP